MTTPIRLGTATSMRLRIIISMAVVSQPTPGFRRTRRRDSGQLPLPSASVVRLRPTTGSTSLTRTPLLRRATDCGTPSPVYPLASAR